MAIKKLEKVHCCYSSKLDSNNPQVSQTITYKTYKA